MSSNQLNCLSEQLLLKVKMKEDTSILQGELKELPPKSLKQYLTNDDLKKAFWINIYNASFLILRKDKKIKKSHIYTKRLVSIAGRELSLDDIEHGLLRKYRCKYSLGFFGNPFASGYIKEHMVVKFDYRIHFALNCGAKSCPPIAFYNSNKINFQLDMATQSFLEGESDFDYEQKVVRTTKLFMAYYWDFGGKKGIKNIFFQHLNKDLTDYKIVYKKYSWDEHLDNFVSESPY